MLWSSGVDRPAGDPDPGSPMLFDGLVAWGGPGRVFSVGSAWPGSLGTGSRVIR
jgi:hypothetical protein